jgi:hypothetical protein
MSFSCQNRVRMDANAVADMATRVWMIMSSLTKTEIRVMTRRSILMISEGGGWLWSKVGLRVQGKKAASGQGPIVRRWAAGNLCLCHAHDETSLRGGKDHQGFNVPDLQ